MIIRIHLALAMLLLVATTIAAANQVPSATDLAMHDMQGQMMSCPQEVCQQDVHTCCQLVAVNQSVGFSLTVTPHGLVATIADGHATNTSSPPFKPPRQ